MTSITIDSLDLIVPEVWEGPSAGIHLDVVEAGRSPFGGTILSGITAMIRCCLPMVVEVGWEPPRSLTWSFDDAIPTAGTITVEWAREGPSWEGSMKVRDRSVCAGRLEYGASDLPPPRQGVELATPGRTLFQGDRRLFEWWVSAHGVPPVPDGMIPWPVLVSLAGGLLVRVPIIEMEHTDMLNRAMDWSFYRPLKEGETVQGIIHDRTERVSKSRPDFGIWQGTMDVVREDEPSDIIASVRWTVMFTHS